MARDRSRVGGCVHRRRGGLAHPDRYQSTAKLHVDTNPCLPLDGGLGISADLDQQVRMLARTLIRWPNIERRVDDPALGSARRHRRSARGAPSTTWKKIKVDPSGSGNLYQLSYRDTGTPIVPGRADGPLVEMFVDSGTDSKRRDSEDASRFIDQQIKELRDEADRGREPPEGLQAAELRRVGRHGPGLILHAWPRRSEQVNRSLDLSAGSSRARL